MASYRNFNELMSAILNDKDVKNDIVLKRNKKNDQALREYASELRNMINKNLRAYYSSYSPLMYDRTNKLKTSINTYFPVMQSGQNISAVLQFNDKAWHENAVQSDSHISFVPELLNYGWHVKDSKVIRNNRFYYYEGSFYITNAIEEFNSMYSSQGIIASISHN